MMNHLRKSNKNNIFRRVENNTQFKINYDIYDSHNNYLRYLHDNLK